MSQVLLKEIRNVGIITFAMGVLQFIIACIAGYFGLPAILGTLLGCAIAVVNFALMGIILEMCMHGKGMAAGLTGFGYILRLAMIALVVIWAMKADYLNYVCVIIPLLFPQAAVFIINGLRRKNGDKDERS